VKKSMPEFIMLNQSTEIIRHNVVKKASVESICYIRRGEEKPSNYSNHIGRSTAPLFVERGKIINTSLPYMNKSL